MNWIASRTQSFITPRITGIVNAASGAVGAIAPGELISIFADDSLAGIGPAQGVALKLEPNGAVSRSLGGATVTFIEVGTTAPLTFAGSGQINAAVPYEIAGLSSVHVQTTFAGVSSESATLAVGKTAPGIFTANGSGSGSGAILNHDGSPNTTANPEPRGGIIVVFATGEGQTSPAGVTGSVTATATTGPVTPPPVASVTATINGQSAQILFAGEGPV